MRKALKRMDRLHHVGQMAASIAHEIRNPLTTVRGYLQYFNNKEVFQPFTSQFGLMIDELDRANHIITEYLFLAKDKSMNKKITHLTDIVKNIFPLLESKARMTDKQIVMEIQDVPLLLLDEQEIRQLIFNLVFNGFDAMSSGGKVTIRTYVENGGAMLVIQDEGCGIPANIANNIGTPFVTTKEQGTGLGVAICYSIAERHGAKICFDTNESGTTVNIFFTLQGIQ